MSRFFATVALKVLLTLFAACVGVVAVASDHITARSYWQDVLAQSGLEDAKIQKYTPFEGVLGLGYTQSATWIRLSIKPPEHDRQLILRIRPIFLDEITLYDPLDTSGRLRQVGDTSRVLQAEYKSLTYTFVIDAGDQPRDIWLRLKTNSTSLINIEAFTPQEMQQSEFNLQLIYFFILALVTTFVLLGLNGWMNYREPLYVLFVIRQFYHLAYALALFGFLNYFLSGVLSPDRIDAFFSWIAIGGTLLTLIFEYKFLSEYAPPRWARHILRGLIFWSLFVATLLLFGHVFQALKLNMVLNTVSIVTLLVVSVIFIDDHQTQVNFTSTLLRKKLVVGYYLIANLVLVFCLLPYLGLMKGNEFAVNALVFYTISSGFLMGVLMQLRAGQIQRAKNAFEQELYISKKEVELEKNRREEQTHLFHMLMHELKNPLAIIDMALLAKNDLEKTSHYVNRAVSNMKAILERCVKTDKLTEGNVAVHKVQVNLNHFLTELLCTEGRDSSQVKLEIQGSLNLNTDAQFLSIMFSNLVDNAVRYGDRVVAAQVNAQATRNAQGAQGVSITVSNRPGIASWPDPQKVFTKYYRSSGSEAQSGTGLGLYLVRTLARIVGGDCFYVPDEKLIQFELWLPS